MRAMCSKCKHVLYTFPDNKKELAPEVFNSIEDSPRVVCEYDGSIAVTAPGNQKYHHCHNCTIQEQNTEWHAKLSTGHEICKRICKRLPGKVLHAIDCPNIV